MKSNQAKVKTKVEVLDLIARSKDTSQLGLFVGAGFSMALTDYDLALRWPALLLKVAEKLLGSGETIEFDKFLSLPEIASNLCIRLVKIIRVLKIALMN